MTTKLPVKHEYGGLITEGFFTPLEDKTFQTMLVPPRRVLPIIFIPGIMGSNLRTSPATQELLGKSNNIAWRPDRLGEAAYMLKATPRVRQLLLNPDETEVDTYVPGQATGNKEETSEQRHKLKIGVSLDKIADSPLLFDDPPAVSSPRTKEEKARERGWGEVYFSSYREVLECCEQALNSRPGQGIWQEIIGKDPSAWAADDVPKLQPLTLPELTEAVKGVFFPVHAMGYNWLQSNADSAAVLKGRILALIEKYRAGGYECKKVILITHSMGGLVARALVHPDIGGLGFEVAGVVHGVMPAAGAPAAYKRMRCGFEEQLFGVHPAPKVLGNYGSEVTAVLGNAPGGLQLLPSKAYGNGWLCVRQDRLLFDRFPKNGDPYEEIYKLKDRWYGLLREDWLNPARSPDAGAERTGALLDAAKRFHESIAQTYHDVSYALYGADAGRPSWETVTWNLQRNVRNSNWHTLQIASDSQQGHLELCAADSNPKDRERIPVELGASSGAGDETVPVRSADLQRQSAKFSGVFRQTGYEHQGSFSDKKVLMATLYCIVRIAQRMKWGNHAC
ncbi:lipase family alpha/beta hydrolase [Massilia endophytica]|uniref:lipase family alpha/beta hydrolase n=1 Tax=Massilia endophytica TaxID=2899220 RepID=UPI001E4050E7|nr:GPI inositol-deacylase [Massilia endophytica]UGQ48199.1 GPI inositol-deacylase [Massilia endophytica]